MVRESKISERRSQSERRVGGRSFMRVDSFASRYKVFLQRCDLTRQPLCCAVLHGTGEAARTLTPGAELCP
jgi:hypothetical protein